MSSHKKALGLCIGAGLGGWYLASRWSHSRHHQSLTSYLVHLLLEQIDVQAKTNQALEDMDIDRVDQTLIQANRKTVFNPFSRFSCKGIEQIYKGMQVFCWNDRGDADQPILLYFHGGGYVRYPLLPHMNMIHMIGRRSGSKIIMPVYPKAPEYTYQDALGPLKDLYCDILSGKSDQAKLFLLGDSAGGGLALAFSYYLIDQGITPPDHLTLVSPWLDLSNSHDKIQEGLEREVFFGHAPLDYAGLRWAGDESKLKCKYVSPIFGDVNELSSPISLLVGTHEAFYYDTLDLAERLKEVNLLDDLMIGEKQHHDWLLYPTPEARQARRRIADRLRLLVSNY